MSDRRDCHGCGTPLQPGDRFCVACGLACAAPPDPAPEPPLARPRRVFPIRIVAGVAGVLAVAAVVTMVLFTRDSRQPGSRQRPASLADPARDQAPPTPTPDARTGGDDLSGAVELLGERPPAPPPALPTDPAYLDALDFDGWQRRQQALADGLKHYYGQGVATDYAAARQSFEEAAPGEGRACYYLGEIHAQGKGVDPDARVAMEWFAKGAERGDAECQFALGMYYVRGEPGVVSPDSEQAVRWLSAAAAQGHREANVRLRELRRAPGAA